MSKEQSPFRVKADASSSARSLVSDLTTSSTSSTTEFQVVRRNSALRSSIVQEELTINKLRLSKVGFYGRQAEVATLQECLERVSSKEGSREVVWLKGYSPDGSRPRFEPSV